MARTKASVGAKVSSGKSNKARCSVAPPASSSGGSSSSDRGSKSSGGNPVCHRETPKWQRGINTFFVTKPSVSEKTQDDTDDNAGTSKPKPKPKRNIIESDEEEDSPEKPKNKELDETIELEPLSGENSHKIEEFYPKNGVKGKGVGKKTKQKDDKENIDQNGVDKDNKDIINNNERVSKRVRAESDDDNVSKKIKV